MALCCQELIKKKIELIFSVKQVSFSSHQFQHNCLDLDQATKLVKRLTSRLGWVVNGRRVLDNQPQGPANQCVCLLGEGFFGVDLFCFFLIYSCTVIFSTAFPLAVHP